jgi:hypothetical protein
MVRVYSPITQWEGLLHQLNQYFLCLCHMRCRVKYNFRVHFWQSDGGAVVTVLVKTMKTWLWGPRRTQSFKHWGNVSRFFHVGSREQMSCEGIQSLTRSSQMTVWMDDCWMSAIINRRPFTQTIIPTQPFIPNQCRQINCGELLRIVV